MIAPPPPGIIGNLKNYVEERIPPGDFLYAVLCNDLCESFCRADDQNRAAMFEIVAYCWNHIPATCWGSPERVQAWLKPTPPEEEAP
jgi:hypothetical protein